MLLPEIVVPVDQVLNNAPCERADNDVQGGIVCLLLANAVALCSEGDHKLCRSQEQSN
jgi:hypothetical protein